MSSKQEVIGGTVVRVSTRRLDDEKVSVVGFGPNSMSVRCLHCHNSELRWAFCRALLFVCDLPLSEDNIDKLEQLVMEVLQ
jgi:hypothetical protein